MWFFGQNAKFDHDLLDCESFFTACVHVLQISGTADGHPGNKKFESRIELMDRTQTSDGIAAILRERIALAEPEAEQKFPEGALAKEFDVSRTPIRQALQRLEYERLITIRPGVGSIVVPLDRNQRDMDISVACATLLAAADCSEDNRLPFETGVLVSGQLSMLNMAEEIDPVVHFKARAQFLQTIAETIPSDILRDAFSASYWRLVRWRVADFADNPVEQGAHFKEQLMSVFKATTHGRAGTVLRAIVNTEQSWPQQLAA